MTAPKSPKRIALLSESTDLGGGERIVAHLIAYWLARGVEVVLIVPDRVADGWLAGYARNLGVTVCTVGFRTSRLLQTVFELASILRTQRVDAAHAHMFGMSVVGSLAGRMAGVPVICTLHNGDEDWPLLKRRLPLAAALRACGVCCVVSDAMREQVGRATWITPHRLQVVYNGAPPSPWTRAAARAELGIASSARLLLCLGSRTRNKSFATAVRAVAAMHDTPELTLMVVGREADDAEDMRAALPLAAGRVRIMDHTPDPGALIAAADALVVCSQREGLPMVIVEAMLAGTPVVSTPVGAIPEILQDGESALFFAVGDVDALRRQLTRLLNEPELAARLGRAGLEIAASRLTLDAMGDRYRSLIGQSL